MVIISIAQEKIAYALVWVFHFCPKVIIFAVRFFLLLWGFFFCRESFLLLRGYFFCRDSCGPPYISFSKRQRIKNLSVSYIWRKIIIQLTIDFFLIKQLRTAYKMPILPCKRRVWSWVLSPEDYKEPEAAFKKVTSDKEGFENYFRNKSTSAQIGSSECWEVRVTSIKSRGILNHLQSFVSSFSYFVFLNQLQRLLCLLQYMKEVDSRISYAVQDNWMLLLNYCENAWSYRLLN